MRRNTLLAVIIVAALCTACNPIDTVQRRWRAEQLKHTDVMPARAGGYIGAARLDTITAIAFTDPGSGQARTITDKSVISQMLRLVSDGRPRATVSGSKLATPLKLTLTLDPPERIVTFLYIPDKDRILLYNTPDIPWPQHYVGNYAVAPEFGAALMQILDAPH